MGLDHFKDPFVFRGVVPQKEVYGKAVASSIPLIPQYKKGLAEPLSSVKQLKTDGMNRKIHKKFREREGFRAYLQVIYQGKLVIYGCD